MNTIQPVILSGGSGTRLWPISRSLYPKQLLQLVTDQSMIQDTALRVSDSSAFNAPMVICNTEHRFSIASQIQEAGLNLSTQVLEPFGRNTAPAAAAAAILAGKADPQTILLILPADHFIRDTKGFADVVQTGAAQAQKGYLVTFGIQPTAPETGYGYIKRGDELDGGSAYLVDQFKEKPKRATAEAYVADGGYYWNSGIFMFRADRLLEEMERFCPDIVKQTRLAVDQGVTDLDFFRLDPEAFDTCPSDSIDYAVMEHTDKAVVIPADMGWNDIGSWAALWDVGQKDNQRNVTQGDVLAFETERSYLRSDGRLVVGLGVRDLVVVDTADVVLVADRKRAEDVKAVVEALEERGRTEHKSHTREYRPWGFFESLHVGDRHQVKHLQVNPGSKLSLQLHHKRAEHWVVVRGEAVVTVGDEVKTLKENESVYIPVESKHRLENQGSIPLDIIEVQSGSYLGEDDIVRFEDDYKRHQDMGDAAE